MKQANWMLLLGLATGASLGAQSLSSTVELKQACETAPGNVVTITGAVEINQGAVWPAMETIDAGCTLVLARDAKLFFTGVGISFQGPFTVQSALKTEIVLKDTAIVARSVLWPLTGGETNVVFDRARVRATEGNFAATFGRQSKWEVKNQLPGADSALEAAGAFSVHGGAQFTFVLEDANAQAGTGIGIAAAGADIVIKTDRADLRTANGPLTIASPSAKAVVEMIQGVWSSGSGIDVLLGGSETMVKATGVDFRAGGGITLEAGTGAARLGKLEVKESRFAAGSTVRLLSSLTGTLGAALVENTELTGPAGVQVESGARGETLFKTNRGSSAGPFTVLTGRGGSCLAEDNRVQSPGTRLCF
jgi:hypothetical protein